MSNIPGTRDSSTRRSILGWAGLSVALTAAYGTFAAFIARYLQPGRSQRSWLYVARSRQLPEGAARLFTTPSGASVNITRQGSTDSDLVALSSICPHLGCQVTWEGHNDRFFCPCHNGVFDSAAGETEDEVEELAEFLEAAQLDWAGFFPYSAEEGTDAASLPDQVPQEGISERLRYLHALQDDITAQRNAAVVGRTMSILVDQVEDGQPVGRSYREAPEIDGMILLDRGAAGTWVEAEIDGGYGNDLSASVVER